ncbi:hypothetical protein C8Q77DRAFT_1152311 [Trametes polyzona]|nr:hypothetical protein C8Q77DRAFT_1152311 [Trametes polyzona]
MASQTSLYPPYYLLVSHSQPLSDPAVAPSTSLSHPVIEYHYADDAPNSLLPQFPGEHVLVLDYDPARPASPVVQSLSPDLAVSAVKVADAPGAAVAGEPALRNNSMYLIETTTRPIDDPPEDDAQQQHVHDILARYKQRNAILHRILDYPNPPAARDTSGASPPPGSSVMGMSG